MTPEELKAQLEELKAQKTEITQLKDELSAKNTEITNLDASVKAQQKEIDALKTQVKSGKKMTEKQAIKAQLEEKKEDIENFVKTAADKDSMTIEVKFSSTDIADRSVFGTVTEAGVSSAPHSATAFLDNLPIDTVTAVSVGWLEGESTSNADYVEELAESKSDTHSVTEKHRSFGKIASHALISSEVSDFFGQVADWVNNEAVAGIEAKADKEIIAGAGADGSAPRKIYGVKDQATAFAALGAYTMPTVADVIKDATLQIRKAGFTANLAIVSFDALPAIEGAKDANGNLMYNQITGYLEQTRIVPSAALEAKQIFVCDSTKVRIKRRPTIEVEIKRNAAKDGYDIYVRRAYQALIKKGDKGAAVWVADSSTAITAITKS